MIKLQLPIAGMRLTRSPLGDINQYFGENLNPLYAQLKLAGHNGIDIGCVTGTPVLAAHDGTIITVNNAQNIPPDQVPSKGYGCYVQHPEGWFTVYWHMISPNLTVGQQVKAGDPLGYSDNTGQSTGPHLHFALYPFPRDMNNGYGGAIDPLPYLKLGLLQVIAGLYQKVLDLIKGRQTTNTP